MLVVPMLQIVDEGREIVLILVVDVDVVLEKLDVELVVEVVEVDGLQVGGACAC